MKRTLLLALIVCGVVLLLQLFPSALDVRFWPSGLSIILWPILALMLIVASFDVSVLRLFVTKSDDAVEYPELPVGLLLAIYGALTCVVIAAIASMLI